MHPGMRATSVTDCEKSDIEPMLTLTREISASSRSSAPPSAPSKWLSGISDSFYTELRRCDQPMSSARSSWRSRSRACTARTLPRDQGVQLLRRWWLPVQGFEALTPFSAQLGCADCRQAMTLRIDWRCPSKFAAGPAHRGGAVEPSIASTKNNTAGEDEAQARGGDVRHARGHRPGSRGWGDGGGHTIDGAGRRRFVSSAGTVAITITSGDD